MIHELKTWKEYFKLVLSGEKPFELRKNDRNFLIGDKLILKEIDKESNLYTGRTMHRRITYVLKGADAVDFGLKEGYCILALEKV